MPGTIDFTLSFFGNDADRHEIDFYDAAQALHGFQRSLALTTHLIVNGEIITQAPALKNARVLVRPIDEGSWKVTAIILAGIGAAATAPRDTPLGHLIYSTYDFIVSESLGFHVDYEKPLGVSFEEIQQSNSDLKVPKQHQLDSLAEKCQFSLTEIHRPISHSASAQSALITTTIHQDAKEIGGPFTQETYDFIKETVTSEEPEIIEGYVSSYNRNTFKGRVYVSSVGHPVGFELTEHCQSVGRVELIVRSLTDSAIGNRDEAFGRVYMKVIRVTSRSGALKRFIVGEVTKNRVNLQ